MSTIVGVRHNGHVVIAGDGFSVSDGTIVSRRTNKVWQWGTSAMIGCSGHARISNLLSGLAGIESPATPESAWADLKAILLADGAILSPQKENGPVGTNVNFILAIGGDLYDVDGAGSIDQVDVAAIGSGGAEARAAACALIEYDRDISAGDIAVRALTSAISCDACSGGDLTVMTIREGVCHDIRKMSEDVRWTDSEVTWASIAQGAAGPNR